MIVAAMAVTIPVSIAGATHPGNHPVKGPGATKPKPHKLCPKPGKKSVKFIIRGVLAEDATATELIVDVTRVNHHAKRALAGPTATGGGAYSVPLLHVAINSCTKITNAGKDPERRTYRALKKGDRVVIGWRKARNTAFVDLGPAIRVVDQGPVPTP